MADRRSILLGLAALPVAGATLGVVADDRADAGLLTLEAELNKLDAEIMRIVLSSGDRDLEDCPGYHEREARRFEVLAEIQHLPAMTFAGLAAKARVLKTRDVTEDYTATGEISASLADDVLRLVRA